jgi:uncharacterized damage-inducible protein DinB
MNTSHASVDSLVQDLEDAQREIFNALEDIPDSELHTAPAENEWTVAELCAHVIEMEPLWLEKIADIVRNPKLQRVEAEVERRTAEVEAHGKDNIDKILRRLWEANSSARGFLRILDPNTLGTRTDRGTAEEGFRSLVINHMLEHADQIRNTRVTVRKT